VLGLGAFHARKTMSKPDLSIAPPQNFEPNDRLHSNKHKDTPQGRAGF